MFLRKLFYIFSIYVVFVSKMELSWISPIGEICHIDANVDICSKKFYMPWKWLSCDQNSHFCSVFKPLCPVCWCSQHNRAPSESQTNPAVRLVNPLDSLCRSLFPVHGGCGAGEKWGGLGDHVHPQLWGHDRGDISRPQRGAQPPVAHLASYR